MTTMEIATEDAATLSVSLSYLLSSPQAWPGAVIRVYADIAPLDGSDYLGAVEAMILDPAGSVTRSALSPSDGRWSLDFTPRLSGDWCVRLEAAGGCAEITIPVRDSHFD